MPTHDSVVEDRSMADPQIDWPIESQPDSKFLLRRQLWNRCQRVFWSLGLIERHGSGFRKHRLNPFWAGMLLGVLATLGGLYLGALLTEETVHITIIQDEPGATPQQNPNPSTQMDITLHGPLTLRPHPSVSPGGAPA